MEASRHNGGGLTVGANLSALVVDDDRITGRIHAGYMTKNGFATQIVDNGKKAIDLFKAGNYFNLVLMDMNMPVMDGIQATRALREMGITSTIIGVTACTPYEADEFKAAGLDLCFSKPLDSDKLAAILKPFNRDQ